MQDRRLRVDYTLWIVNMIVISYHCLTRQASVQRVYAFLQFDRLGGEILSLKYAQTPFNLFIVVCLNETSTIRRSEFEVTRRKWPDFSMIFDWAVTKVEFT